MLERHIRSLQKLALGILMWPVWDETETQVETKLYSVFYALQCCSTLIISTR